MIRILLVLLAGTSWAGPLRTAVIEAPVVPITGGLSAGAGLLAGRAGVQPRISSAGILPPAVMGGLPSVAAALPAVSPLPRAVVAPAVKPAALPALQAVSAAVSPEASRPGTSAGNALTRAFDGAGVREGSASGGVSVEDLSPKVPGSGLSPAGRGKSSVKGEPPDQPAPPQQPAPPVPGGPLKPWQIAALVVGGLLVLAVIGYLAYDVGVKMAEWLATMEAGLRNSAGDPFGFE